LLQRLYDFDAARYGISDELAAAIATVFSAFDSDANGVLSLDEFTRLWWVEGLAVGGSGQRSAAVVVGGCCDWHSGVA
jgi:hypothetical protein